MTDRQRFETNALAHGATIVEADDMQLTILATDGHMVTTYRFNEDGCFKSISTTYREI